MRLVLGPPPAGPSNLRDVCGDGTKLSAQLIRPVLQAIDARGRAYARGLEFTHPGSELVELPCEVGNLCLQLAREPATELLLLHLRRAVNRVAPSLHGADLIAFLFQRGDNGNLVLTLANLVRSQRAAEQSSAESPEEAEAGAS